MIEEECREKLRTLGRELHKKPDGNFYILDPRHPGAWSHGPGYSLVQVQAWIDLCERWSPRVIAAAAAAKQREQARRRQHRRQRAMARRH
jgi:hypothetical protein